MNGVGDTVVVTTLGWQVTLGPQGKPCGECIHGPEPFCTWRNILYSPPVCTVIPTVEIVDVSGGKPRWVWPELAPAG
jgi:hypothetical protein